MWNILHVGLRPCLANGDRSWYAELPTARSFVIVCMSISSVSHQLARCFIHGKLHLHMRDDSMSVVVRTAAVIDWGRLKRRQMTFLSSHLRDTVNGSSESVRLEQKVRANHHLQRA